MLTTLVEKYGSQRRIFEAYWKGELTLIQERFLEDSYPPEIRIGMKPLA